MRYDDVDKMFKNLEELRDDILKDRVTSFHFARRNYLEGNTDAIFGLQNLDRLSDLVGKRINELRLKEV